MKKFILGFVCGVIVTIVAVMGVGYYASSKANSSDMPGLTRIENGETIPCKQIKIFQVIRPNVALAYLSNKIDGYDSNKILVLFIGDAKENYYDDQKIIISDGKSIKRVGTYSYKTKVGHRTVPAVKIQ